MKKLVLFCLLFAATFVSAQEVFNAHYRHVKAENVAEFENLESEYWQKIAQKAVDAGEIEYWVLLRRVNTIGLEETEPTHVFITGFTSPEKAFDTPSTWWSKGDQSKATTNISKAVIHQFWKTEDRIPGAGKYVIFNYATPKDLDGFVKENSSLWKPYFDKNKAMTGMKFWGMASKIDPHAKGYSTVLTWDGFDKLSDAMNHLSYGGSIDQSILDKTKMNDINPDGFNTRAVMEIISFAMKQ